MEFDRASRTFVRRAGAIPPLQSGQVLVRVTCCTLCGSDLHTFSGRREAPNRCVLGHEIIGEVVAWGDGDRADFHGNPLRAGQRVTWAMAVGCGTCFFCRNGLNQKCESLFKYGHEPGGAAPTGGLSEYCVLTPSTPVFPIPDGLSDEVAAPANCATATVTAAMRLIKQTHLLQGATALVVGAGMLGLTAAAQLSDAGAQHVVVADLSAKRVAMAESFGATHTLCSADQTEIKADLQSLTAGRGADVALDFAGVLPAVETCIASVRLGGCVLLAGSVFPSGKLSISPELIVRHMLTVRGLHNYLPNDLDQGLRFLERTHDRFPFGQLVTKSFSLENAQQAFEHADEQRPVRVAVGPSE